MKKHFCVVQRKLHQNLSTFHSVAEFSSILEQFDGAWGKTLFNFGVANNNVKYHVFSGFLTGVRSRLCVFDLQTNVFAFCLFAFRSLFGFEKQSRSCHMFRIYARVPFSFRKLFYKFSKISDRNSKDKRILKEIMQL